MTNNENDKPLFLCLCFLSRRFPSPDTPLRVTTGMDKENKLTEVITELVPKAEPSTFDVQIQVCSSIKL